MTTNVTKTGGHGINFNYASRSTLDLIKFDFMFNAVYVQGYSVILNFNRLFIINTIAASGTGIYINGGNDHYITNCLMDNPLGSEPYSGIRIRQSGATWIDNTSVLHARFGLVIDPQAGERVTWLFVMNSAFDLCSENGIMINGATATSTILGATFIGTWSSSCTQEGVELLGVAGSNMDGISFIGHRAYTNGTHGIAINYGINLKVESCSVSGNSTTASDTSSGISVAAGITKFEILNNRSGLHSGQANTQKYGIQIESGASNNYTIMGNNVINNVSGGIFDSGTGTSKIVKDNLTGDSVDIASATTVTLNATGDYFNITGTTNITSVTASWVGRRVTLKFAGILTFTDGSNLKTCWQSCNYCR